ncbi:MAG TPA: hypothetical protein PKE40_01210 [Arachnia sp.]|nr:hypothetical protein [Arachnia sp.]HMT84946.1 hypothetical protein [Arachnia sp.]
MSVDLGPIHRSIQEMGAQVVRTLGTQIDGVRTQVGTVSHDVQTTRAQLVALRDEFQAYVAEAGRVAHVQQSQVKVVDLKAQLDREFGHYNVVRRTSVGLLQAFDVGNISDEIATSISEELMLQTPRYWLAPALVALAAWSHDREDMAERSVREAFNRDRHKTSLFFALVLRRQGRLSGSVRWLRHYVASLDPSALTREFAIILEASSYQAFGPEGEQLLSKKLSQWSSELRDRPGTEDEQVQRWFDEIRSHQLSVAANEYPTLRSVSGDWLRWKTQLEAASALPEVLVKYEKVRDFEAQIPSSLEDLLDDILDSLVSEYDEEELPLRREVIYHEAVIDEHGDLDRAQAKADLLHQAVQETNDVVSLQTMGAISPELVGVSVQTQRVAIGVSQQDFRSAVGRYSAAYRSAALQDAALTFTSDHSSTASQYGFDKVSFPASLGEERSTSMLRAAWDKTMAGHIQKARFDNKYYVKPAAIAAAVVVVLFLLDPIIGLLALAASAVVVWYLGDQKRKAAEQEVQALENAREEGYRRSVQLLHQATAELADVRVLYNELDAYEARVLDLIDGWPVANQEA